MSDLPYKSAHNPFGRGTMKRLTMNTRRGFTLIELMIVIAIIAVIAAIAIPGLIASQRAANERNASASLKTFTSAEVDFRSNDRDNNKIQDFWTRDVSGLYTLCPIGSDQPVKLIDLSLCGADSNPLGTAPTPSVSDHIDNSYFTIRAPKASFWYLALENDDSGQPYAGASFGIAPFTDLPWFHRTKFGFLTYPENYSAGRQIFIVNEVHAVFRRVVVGEVRPAGATVPPGSSLRSTGAIGTAPLNAWPTDPQLRLDYSRLD